MDYQAILEEIHHEVLQVLPCGTVATYIPHLATVSPHKFGMAVQTIDGKLFHVSQALEGGIVGVIPNRLTVAVWSPGLNEKGNSFAGQYALELFTTKTGVSIF